MANNEITSIEDLKRYSNGAVVELPSYGEGQRFFAQLKRPSLMALMKKGKIPNSLLTTANQIFADTDSLDVEDENTYKDVFDVMELMCEATFVKPTYKELKEAGIELTDEQMFFVFNYSQRGVDNLSNFREQSEDRIGTSDMQEI